MDVKEIKKEQEERIIITNTDFEVRSLDGMCYNESELKHPFWYNIKYLVLGIFLVIQY